MNSIITFALLMNFVISPLFGMLPYAFQLNPIDKHINGLLIRQLCLIDMAQTKRYSKDAAPDLAELMKIASKLECFTRYNTIKDEETISLIQETIENVEEGFIIYVRALEKENGYQNTKAPLWVNAMKLAGMLELCIKYREETSGKATKKKCATDLTSAFITYIKVAPSHESLATMSPSLLTLLSLPDNK